MKRHLFQTLLIVTFSLVSCGRINDIPGEEPGIRPNAVSFTATLAPKSEDTIKAITSGRDGENKEILNVAWAGGEQVAVYYRKTDDSYATATATVGEPNADGSAPLTATLTDAKGGMAKFVYPATLANATGDIDETALYNNQKGTLADISANFDAATGTGTIAVSGSEASVGGIVSMENRVCICKFSFTYKYAVGTVLTLNKLNSLTIKTASGDYTISPASPATMGDVYLAMLPCSGANFVFIANASYTEGYVGSTSNFMAFPTDVSLTAGKFYRDLPIALTLKALPTGAAWKDLSAGSITASDGDVIWQSNSSATQNTITIPDGISVFICDVNISSSGSAGIICEGNATIKTEGTNTITATSDNYPAIQAGGSGTTLTINGGGSLEAKGARYGTGIGSGRFGTCGNITISGGTVKATGRLAPGIGSSDSGTCGDILIDGGNVRAIAGDFSAGIGCGHKAHCGRITITSGVKMVYAQKGGTSLGPYCIGKGREYTDIYSTCGIITIGGTTRSQDEFAAVSFTYQP